MSYRYGCDYYRIPRCADPECPQHGSPPAVHLSCEWFAAWDSAPSSRHVVLRPTLAVPVPVQLAAGANRMPVARLLRR